MSTDKVIRPKFSTQLLRNFESLKSHEVYMISEMIDNSIASFTNNEIQNPVKGLKIEILIESLSNKKKLTISDNANGFTYKTLSEGLEIGRNRLKSGGHFYNKGLKQAAFWSGLGLKIESISSETNEAISVDIDVEKLENYDSPDKGTVYYTIEALENKLIAPITGELINHGTIATFYNVYNYRWNYDDLIHDNKNYNDDKNYLKIILETKYSKLLHNGLKIRLKWVEDIDSKRNFDIKLKSNSIRTEELYKWAQNTYNSEKRYIDGSVYKNFDSFLDAVKNDFTKILKQKVEDSGDANNPLNKKEVFDRIIEEIWKENVGIVFNEKIKLQKVVDGKEITLEVPGKVGLLRKVTSKKEAPQGFTDWKGFAFTQFNRAIVCPPNNFKGDNDFKAYQVVDDHPGQGLQPRTRIFGEFDLDNLWKDGIRVAKPDDNKKDFTWEDFDCKTEFYAQLKRFAELKYDSLAKAVHEIQAKYSAVFSENGQADTTVNDIGEKTSKRFKGIENYTYNDAKKSNEYTFRTEKGEHIIIEVLQNNHAQNNDNLVDSSIVEEGKIEVRINLNHVMWKPLIDATANNLKEGVESLEKLAVIFGLSDLIFNEKYRVDLGISEQQSVTQILSAVTKRVVINND